METDTLTYLQTYGRNLLEQVCNISLGDALTIWLAKTNSSWQNNKNNKAFMLQRKIGSVYVRNVSRS